MKFQNKGISIKENNIRIEFSQNNNVKKVRYHLLDLLRGITILSMVLFHGTWDLVFLYGCSIPWYISNQGYIWQQSICWTFIFLSGFCWSMGGHKLKRGLIVFGAGLLVTVITLVLMPEERVVFGVLTLHGTCMILAIILKKVLELVPSKVGFAANILLFFIFRDVNEGYLGFEKIKLVKIPKVFYQNMLTTFLGFPTADFYSTDYFSLLPWIFLFLSGYYWYHIIKNHKKVWDLLQKHTIVTLEWVGKHSLGIYLLHQPLIFGILYLIFGVE